MQPTTTNGSPASAREVLDTLRQHIDRLEADVSRQQQEIQALRVERDEALAMFAEMKRFIRELPEWERFDPAEYTCTSDDIRADLRSM